MRIQHKRTVSVCVLPCMFAMGTLMLVGVGCSGAKVTTKTSTELERYQIRTIALVPFTILTTPQVRDVRIDSTIPPPPEFRPGGVVRMPMGRPDAPLKAPPNTEPTLQQTVTVPASAGDTVTQLLWNRLRARQGVTVLSPTESEKVLASPATSKPSPNSSPAVIVAKQLKVDAALIGQVLVYQERVGGRFGANPPATVGFEAKVVAADGQVLWEGNYYEEQRPATEDLMGFIQRRGMFVTAEELARYGVEQMLLEFPFGTIEAR